MKLNDKFKSIIILPLGFDSVSASIKSSILMLLGVGLLNVFFTKLL